MAKRKEDRLQKNIAQYVRAQYPGVIFTSDASGINLSIGYAKKLKRMRSGHQIPDIIFLVANKKYHGLLIELKTEQTTILNKDRTYRSAVKEQAESLHELRKAGFAAYFACGFDQAKDIIDAYICNDEIKLFEAVFPQLQITLT